MAMTAILIAPASAPAAALRAADKGPPATEVTIPTYDRQRALEGKEAQEYAAGTAWLEGRMKDAQSIRVGSTHAEVAKLLRHDGGFARVGHSRLVPILCPYVKIDVELETPKGAKPGGLLPPAAKVAKVSKPYLGRGFEG